MVRDSCGVFLCSHPRTPPPLPLSRSGSTRHPWACFPSQALEGGRTVGNGLSCIGPPRVPRIPIVGDSELRSMVSSYDPREEKEEGWCDVKKGRRFSVCLPASQPLVSGGIALSLMVIVACWTRRTSGPPVRLLIASPPVCLSPICLNHSKHPDRPSSGIYTLSSLLVTGVTYAVHHCKMSKPAHT